VETFLTRPRLRCGDMSAHNRWQRGAVPLIGDRVRIEASWALPSVATQEPMRRESSPPAWFQPRVSRCPPAPRSPDHWPAPGQHANTVTGLDRIQEAHAP